MKKYLIWLCLLVIVEIGLSLYLTMWREHFWDAISAKQGVNFLVQLCVFTGIALFLCLTNGITGYLLSLTSIEWRNHLNTIALTVCHLKHENMNQRCQEDCRDYPNLYLNLIFGTIKAFVYVLVFSISLIYSFSWVYLTILFVYAILGTVLTHYVANPLIHLNYESQRLEATYRNGLTELNYKECVRVMLGLAKKQKHVTYLQQFYGQIGVILPIMAIAPLYFSTSMSLGLLMRFNSVSGTILDNLSYGVNSFSDINRLLSCKKRLKEAQIL